MQQNRIYKMDTMKTRTAQNTKVYKQDVLEQRKSNNDRQDTYYF
jgi:hypothetical protein